MHISRSISYIYIGMYHFLSVQLSGKEEICALIEISTDLTSYSHLKLAV